MSTQAKPDSKPEPETKPARERFRKQIRTGITAGGNDNRLFDSQNQNGGQLASRPGSRAEVAEQ
jgi:hypothetical protein